MEELCVINLLQFMDADMHRAKLIRVPNIDWHTEFACPNRRQRHEDKMKSKEERGEKQRKALGLMQGMVLHIDT